MKRLELENHLFLLGDSFIQFLLVVLEETGFIYQKFDFIAWKMSIKCVVRKRRPLRKSAYRRVSDTSITPLLIQWNGKTQTGGKKKTETGYCMFYMDLHVLRPRSLFPQISIFTQYIFYSLYAHIEHIEVILVAH